MVRKIEVKLKSGNYPVLVGSDLLPRMRQWLQKQIKGDRLFVFYDAQFYALHGPRIQSGLGGLGRQAMPMVIPSGEISKSASALNRIYDVLLSERISRSDFILAVGGGVTSDLVGYAAATTLRGIRWGIVSTTLLGMVDAAIGGKTGINHRSGKNLIGAFWQPRAVFCDSYFLNTLSRRQLLAGIGEVAKYAGLAGETILRPLESYLAAGDLYNEKSAEKLIRLSAAYKAGIVSCDEREKGMRMLLNLGHTVGHGIESSVGYGRLFHGEAVLLGLWAAVELSCLVNPAAARRLTAYRRLIEESITYIPRRKIDVQSVLEAMKIDKKRHSRRQKYVLLERPGKPFIADDVKQRLVRVSLERMVKLYNLRAGKHA